MHLLQRSLVAAAAVVFAGCSNESPAPAGPTRDLDNASRPNGTHFRTSQPAQAQKLVPQAVLFPLISSGDILPGSALPWAPTPDGLGVYRNGLNLVLFANHEITAAGVTSSNGGAPYTFSRVSRLTIDPLTLSIVSGDYVEDGLGGYIRFCSATWADGTEGFPTGYFLTGEENGATNKGSIEVAYDKSGTKTELPHLGALSHENVVPVPGFPGKVVALLTDDSAGQSELYLYVAASEGDFIGGNGKLYVLKTDALSSAGKPLHSGNLVDNQSVAAYFAEISDPADLATAPGLRYANLQSKADAAGALPFVRLEDGDYAKVPLGNPTFYFVDTGSETVTGRPAVGADCGGVCDKAGSLYRLDLNRLNPVNGATLTLVHRSKGINGEWASPDNVAISARSIMIMEDPAFTGWDGSRSPGIWNAQFVTPKRLSTFREVVEVTQTTLVPQAVPGAEGRCIDSANTCWETSGIIQAGNFFGAGTWLFDVQAHTLPFTTQDAAAKQYGKEGGQLLYLYLPGS